MVRCRTFCTDRKHTFKLIWRCNGERKEDRRDIYINWLHDYLDMA